MRVGLVCEGWKSSTRLVRSNWASLQQLLTPFQLYGFEPGTSRTPPFGSQATLLVVLALGEDCAICLPFLQLGSKWTLGNGLSISLWYGHWIDHQSVSSKFPSIQFPPMDRGIDIIHENSWSIPQNMPVDLKDFLLHSTNDILVVDNYSLDTLSWMTPLLVSLLSKLHGISSKLQLSVSHGWAFYGTSMSTLGWPLSLGVFFIKKTPTDTMAKNRGCIMAWRCHNCH